MSLWNATPPSSKTIEFLINILEEKESSIRNQSKLGEAGLVVRRQQRGEINPSRLREIEEKKKVTNCNKCGKIGHWARECHNKPNFVGNVGRLILELSEKWLADTGATSHMCHQREWFTTLEMYANPDWVSVGDGKKIEVWGIGKVNVVAQVGES